MSGAEERYRLEVPGRARIEHLHRYAACRDAVAGLEVLDLACGEGYGAGLLRGCAKRITGLDRDRSAIDAASARFGAPPGVVFVTADATALPFANASFDAVICFEAIEHVEAQAEVLDEIRRVLRPGGFLVISTPDRQLHGLRQDGPNPHHVRELTRREFVDVLAARFARVALYGQGAWSASLLLPEALPGTSIEWVHASTVGEDVDVTPGVSEAHRVEFHLAVCGDASIPALRDGCLADSTYSIADEERLLERRAEFLDRRLTRLHQQVDQLHREVAIRDRALTDSQTALVARDAEARRREDELAAEWRVLNAVLHEKEVALLQSVNAAADQHAEIERLHREVAERDRLIAGRALPVSFPAADTEALAVLRQQQAEARRIIERTRVRAESAEEALAEARIAVDQARDIATAERKRTESLEARLTGDGPGRAMLEARLVSLEAENVELRAARDRLEVEALAAQAQAGRARSAIARMKTQAIGNGDRARELAERVRRQEAAMARVQWALAQARILERRARLIQLAARHEIDRLASIIAGLRSSRSWRITGPLRRLYRWVRLGSLAASRRLELWEVEASRPRDPAAPARLPGLTASGRGLAAAPGETADIYGVCEVAGNALGDACCAEARESGKTTLAAGLMALSVRAREAGLAGLFFELALRGGTLDGLEAVRTWCARDDGESSFGVALAGSWSMPEQEIVAALSGLSDAFAARRYLRIDARPVVLLLISGREAAPEAARVRDCFGRAGLPSIHLRVLVSAADSETPILGFDGGFRLPPHALGDPPAVDADGSFEVLVERAALDDADPGVWPGVCNPWRWARERHGQGAHLAMQDVVAYQNWLVDMLLQARVRAPGRGPVPVLVSGFGEAPSRSSGTESALQDATLMAGRRARWVAESGTSDAPDRLAVVIHAFYPALLADIVARLDGIGRGAHLYATCPVDRESEVRAVLARGRHAWHLDVVPNRGRDMLPFLGLLPRILESGHTHVLKVHTKRSPHRRDGDRWRTDLLDALLTSDAIEAALQRFAASPRLGLLCHASHLVRMPDSGDADARLVQGAARIGVPPDTLTTLCFPAGGMFHARTKAFLPLLALGYAADDFEPEAGQLDGTLAHVVERLVSASVASLRMSSAPLEAAGREVPSAVT